MKKRKARTRREAKPSGRGFLDAMTRVFRYSRKPGEDEYTAYLKIVGLAILVTGGIAFVIHLIASMLTLMLGG